MSQVIFPNDALLVAMEGYILKLATYYGGGHFKMGLYKNNYTPIFSSLLADFIAADFDGYAVSTMGAETGAFINAVNQAELDFPVMMQFTQSGITVTNTIYGYYVFETVDNRLLWAEKFDTPILMDAIGKQINVLARITQGPQF